VFHVEQLCANEIVLRLLREPLHLRALADALAVNHMTIARKLAVLERDNIVDFSIEGKNKVYFLKRSIEGRNYAIASELYLQSKVVAEYPVLRGIIRSILLDTEIRLALIFGSYAKRNVREDSDIDIFIESSDREQKKNLELQNSQVNVKIGKFDINNPLIREIMTDHVILKGVEDYFEKTKFFT
jgi:predicted nucleotidyltransferase